MAATSVVRRAFSIDSKLPKTTRSRPWDADEPGVGKSARSRPPDSPGRRKRSPVPANLWEHAFAWLSTPMVAPPPESRAAPEPMSSAGRRRRITIARELGLREADTPEALHRARRKFMWQNHPDRRADISADLATRRVAIANRLVDRALAQFARRTGVRHARGQAAGGLTRATSALLA